ncbi:MAG: SusC/RagA family TonB-linked outer membrane protein, partial [Bacteroidales bacterium]|nr:SusC/RagA family TonB-linked outer membrane protein [Bacteroidales bacterium]
MKKFTFLFLFLLFAGTHALLAQRTVSGIVTNAEDNEGIPGVQVQAKGTILGATTNMMGQYTITIPEDITALIFTFMGMTPQEIEIGSQTTIDVVMQSDATAIEGVEIVSYGTARRLGTSVGSVSQVSSAQLQGRASANVLDALQGQVAGLQVFSNSGNPNETQTLRLHGLGSLSTTTSSAPLYVVDGIQIEASTVLAMNPNDFESVTVLKDASATSIYGSRAANGVIVITTKRGSRNTDARITLRSQYGFSSMADKSYFDQLMTSDELLSFRENLAIGVWTPEKIADIRNKYGTETRTDGIDVYMRGNAPIFQNDLSIAGGGGKTTYFLSAGQYSQEGTAYGSSFDRYTVRANIESQAKDWLKVGVNTLISRSERSNNADSDWAGLIKINQLPWYSPMDENGNRYDIIPTDGGTRLPHPAYATENKKSLSTVSTLTGSFFVEITPLKGLKFISRSGTNAYLSESDSYTLPSYAEAMSLTTGGVRSIGSGTYITMTTNNVVEYSFELAKKHKITALVGQEGILSNSASEALAVQGLTEDRTMTINGNNNGTLVPGSIISGQSSSASLSFFGRLDYSFDNRFYADFSLRNDASSRFGAKNRNAQFWSIGGMWNMTNEKFIKSTGFITDAKLKVSYGTQGNSG